MSLAGLGLVLLVLVVLHLCSSSSRRITLGSRCRQPDRSCALGKTEHDAIGADRQAPERQPVCDPANAGFVKVQDRERITGGVAGREDRWLGTTDTRGRSRSEK
jgi:hypothetical protein